MRGTATAKDSHSDSCQVSPLSQDTQPPSPSSRRAHLGVPLVVVLLGADPAAHQVVAHRVGQREVIIAGGGDVAVLDEGEVEVAIEALAHLGHVAQPRDAPHADLLPTLAIAQRCRHPAAAAPPALPLPGPGPGRGRRACASSARHEAGPAPLPGRAEGSGRAAGDRHGLGLPWHRGNWLTGQGWRQGSDFSSHPPTVRALALKATPPPRCDFKLGVYCRHSDVGVSPVHEASGHAHSRLLCHVLLP